MAFRIVVSGFHGCSLFLFLRLTCPIKPCPVEPWMVGSKNVGHAGLNSFYCQPKSRPIWMQSSFYLTFKGHYHLRVLFIVFARHRPVSSLFSIRLATSNPHCNVASWAVCCVITCCPRSAVTMIL